MFVQNYERPKSLEEAYQLLLEKDKNQIIGGGAWLKLQNKEIDTIIDLSSIGLNEIIEEGDFIRIGSMTSLRQIETSEIITKYQNGILSKAVKHIMGMNVRNIATIGGSIMGKYSFSDIITPLLVMDVSLVFFNTGTISLEEFLKTKKFQKDILLEVILRKESSNTFFHTVKKTALDFAVINFAISKSEKVKIAIGARPSISQRAVKTEEFINNSNFNKDSIKQALEIALEEIKLGSNSRASKEYRTELIKVYIKRGLMEVMNHEG